MVHAGGLKAVRLRGIVDRIMQRTIEFTVTRAQLPVAIKVQYASFGQLPPRGRIHEQRHPDFVQQDDSASEIFQDYRFGVHFLQCPINIFTLA